MVLVSTAAVVESGVPLRVGDAAKTNAPDPVSSLMTPASSADVVAAKKLSLLTSSATTPPRFCRSWVLLALKVAGLKATLKLLVPPFRPRSSIAS